MCKQLHPYALMAYIVVLAMYKVSIHTFRRYIIIEWLYSTQAITKQMDITVQIATDQTDASPNQAWSGIQKMAVQYQSIMTNLLKQTIECAAAIQKFTGQGFQGKYHLIPKNLS